MALDSDGSDRMTVSPGTVTASARTRSDERPAPTRFALAGSGWRSSVYLRLGYLLPDLFEVTGVLTRTAESGERVAREFGVRAVRSVEELLARDRPDFVVLSVPSPITPELVRELVRRGVPVLAETPPAPDLPAMRSLWSDVGASGLVQVAEQYLWMPLHAARLALVREGLVGTPGSEQVSSTHQYHAVALMRALLGVGIGPASVDAQAFQAPLVDPITPAGWTHDASPKRARTVLAAVHFGSDRTGVYDFTDNQWWNPVRPDHLTVRGSTGEIHDDAVVRMIDDVTAVRSRIERSATGVGMNYEGMDLTQLSFEGRVVFRNRFPGAALSDDDLGTAELVSATGAWTRGDGPPPRPLAEGMHDHHVGIAIEEAARTGRTARIAVEPWVS